MSSRVARAWRLPFTLSAAALPCDHIVLHVGTGRKARCTSCWRSAAAAAGAAAAALAVPPDVTVPVPPVNGSYGGAQTATSSHLGEGSEAADGEGGARESAGAASDLWAAFSFGRGGAESRGGFRAALNQLLRRGNDLEAAAVNHRVRSAGAAWMAVHLPLLQWLGTGVAGATLLMHRLQCCCALVLLCAAAA